MANSLLKRITNSLTNGLQGISNKFNNTNKTNDDPMKHPSEGVGAYHHAEKPEKPESFHRYDQA